VLTAEDKATLVAVKAEVIRLLSPSCVPHIVEEDAPTHYWSAILEEDFWVCATGAQAAALYAEGQVAYMPDEIGLLRDLKARKAATFPEKLQVIHEVKHAFEAVLEALEPPGAAAGAPGIPLVRGACFACSTSRRWTSLSGSTICSVCHPPSAPTGRHVT
jgi:hypothetical protein